MKRFSVLLVVLGGALLGACERPPLDATPEGAFDQFLEACEQTTRDPGAAARACALLAPSSRRALELRAPRATSLIGRSIGPEHIFVPGFTPLRFEISRTTTKLSPDGTHATIEVTGPDPATQHASVPMEREGLAWRVLVDIPN